MVANFWRAVLADPEAVAYHADYPVFEADLHARHGYLVKRRRHLAQRLMGDKDYYSTKLAGYWVWGMAAWIGGGFCSGKGPWVQHEGKLVRRAEVEEEKLPYLTSGQGIKRNLPYLTSGQGINRNLPYLTSGRGQSDEPYVSPYLDHLCGVMAALQHRLHGVIVTCGDWKRLQNTAVRVLREGAELALFLDPPYASEEWAHDGYNASCDFSEVKAWALELGKNPLAKVALCGYLTKQKPPKGWEVLRWKSMGGYGSQGKGKGRENANKETIWFSPACQRGEPKHVLRPLFDD